ncbi:Bug family tripartite tricarboxylate transporter substrate binding protein [Sporomusa termitida]|nr:tripartite tricarboxylate transporter substrate binding protein [Sporomusa termitida]
MIVPFSVGGGSDLIARSLEKYAFKHLGQPLVIINKPGGAGTIGWNELAGENPDGYTIGITASDLLLLSLYESGKYQYTTALDPLAQVTALPMVLAVQAGQPWHKLNDLIEYAKNHPGELKFGNAGIGGFTHVLSETFGQTTDIVIKHVPFSGANETTAALLGGHIQVIFANPMVVREHVKSGTVRILAVNNEQRMVDPIFNSVPTFKEQGLEITLSNWYGIAAPKEMPANIKNKLAKALKEVITDPEFRKDMEGMSMSIEYLDPQESQLKWINDSQMLQKTLQESGILEQIKTQKK